MKAPAESGQICSVGRRKIAKKIAKNKRCYANTLRPTRLPVATLFSRGRRDESHREKSNHHKGVPASSVPNLSQLRPVIVRWSTLFSARMGA